MKSATWWVPKIHMGTNAESRAEDKVLSAGNNPFI
jgi:hypothetical protein